MSVYKGQKLTLSLYGRSHGPGVGAVLTGFPPGEALGPDVWMEDLDRRRPQGRPGETPRREADQPEVLGGIYRGHSSGDPLHFFLANTQQRPGDYHAQALPRPGHADLSAALRYRGYQETAGGGHFSARISAAWVAAGACCRALLRRHGIDIFTEVIQLGALRAPLRGAHEATSEAVDWAELEALRHEPLQVRDPELRQRMLQAVAEAEAAGDSLGGRLEAWVRGWPAGLGGPYFEGLEGRLALALFAVPAVKGLHFGQELEPGEQRGSRYNDVPYLRSATADLSRRYGRRTNNSGGIEGGISSGEALRMQVDFRPTASIAQTQETWDLSGERSLHWAFQGRHDSCLLLRAPVLVEAALALVLADILLDSEHYQAARPRWPLLGPGPRAERGPDPERGEPVRRLLLLNGPNLNCLGRRKAEHYGQFSLADLEEELQAYARARGCQLDSVCSNYEGDLLEAIQNAQRQGYQGLLINAGALTHYSYALADALELFSGPKIEVHISDVEQREAFRRRSVLRPQCTGLVSALGKQSYFKALDLVLDQLDGQAGEERT